MRALVLSGGGSRGAFQVGALKYLMEAEQEREWYKAFCGISVGAINCAYLSQFTMQYPAVIGLLKLWNRLSNKQVKRRWFPFGFLHGLWETGLYNTEPLAKYLKQVHRDAIVNTGNQLRVGAVNLQTGEYRLFDQSYKDLRKAVLASSAFPVMFPPVEIDGQLWSDGGIRNMTPLKTAIDIKEVDEIDIIMASTLNAKANRSRPDNVIDVGIAAFETVLDEILNEDIEKARYYNDKISEGSIGGKVIKLRVVQPQSELPGSSLDFNNHDAREMIEMGHKAAKEQLA